jgi:hypothetical protein
MNLAKEKDPLYELELKTTITQVAIMPFLLKTDNDPVAIVAEATKGSHGTRHVLSYEQLEAHATKSGMLMVFVGDFEGPEHLPERQKALRFAEAAEAAFSLELKALTDGYRRLIRESLPSGRNLAVKDALNRVRVQEQFLAELDMADQAEACELLRLSKSNPSATLRRVEDRGELIRIDRDGRPFYPLFQFDVENGRVYSVIREINGLLPEGWSRFRLCYWMSRKHADFGRAPAELLGKADAEIIDAFRRAIEPVVHG